MKTHAATSIPRRSAGILLHPTSLPGPFGIGDLGPRAVGWIDDLVRAGQSWWQVLPLGPTGYGDSPYQSFSSFAGNTNLLSPELLIQDGLLKPADLGSADFPTSQVDFGRVVEFKGNLLHHAWQAFQAGAGAGLRSTFDVFRVEQADWLDDFALFMALKGVYAGTRWQDWPRELVLRNEDALARVRQELRDAVGMHQFGQFLFFRQWQALRAHARQCGLRLIGDIPIFVAGDSADVWSHPELFQLDKARRPAVVAGVPPDYFSATGQLWGNPLYDWAALKVTGYAWWVERLKAALQQVDLVRIDHFRGFEAYWEVEAGRPTAEIGRWVPGPGANLFAALGEKLGGLPLIAEDLGLITPEVEALREELGLPGMRVLQFAFGGGPDNKYLPHHYVRNTITYTGTHDNDTTVGWFGSRGLDEGGFVRHYAPGVEGDPAGVLLRLAWSSVADLAIAPLQDVLGLGREARMNRPGKPEGNWRWRLRKGLLTEGALTQLAELTALYSRV